MASENHTDSASPAEQRGVLTDTLIRLSVVLAIVLLGIMLTELPTTTVVVVTATPEPTATPLPPTETPLPEPTATLAPTATPVPTEVPAPTEAPDTTAGASNDPALIAEGEALFVQCAACHGPDGRGLPNLGKDLVDSEFVHSLTDDEMLQFIITGRPIWDAMNTTGMDMPGKGGNPALTNDDIIAIIAYVRSLSGGASAVSAAPATSQTAYDPALVTQGETLFMQCAACHGPDGRGLPNLGKDLVVSEFVEGLTDEELLQFIVTGRPIWDAMNTTGVDMPGKGGNPALTNDDIIAIIAYVRTLAAEGQ